MTPNNTGPGRFATAFGGAAFFGVGNLMLWMCASFASSAFAIGHTQDEALGYMAIVTGPCAGLVGAVAGFCVSYFGDRARYLKRWAILALLSVSLCLVFNAYMVHAARNSPMIPGHTLTPARP